MIYLPGMGRADLRAVEDCPRELQPLAELQYRGMVFSHPNGRDWTPAALLGNRLGIEIAGGQKTQNALARALPELLKRPVAELQRLSPLGAGDLDEILISDPERELLVWLDDPRAYAEARSPETRAAFAEVCNARYGFDPDSDGELEARQPSDRGRGIVEGGVGEVLGGPAPLPEHSLVAGSCGASGQRATLRAGLTVPTEGQPG